MSEPTPVFDPPVVENGTSAVDAEASAQTTYNGGSKDDNGQDVTMAGLEETGAKSAKTGADPAVSDNLAVCHRCSPFTSIAFTTTCTTATMTSALQLHNAHLVWFVACKQASSSDMIVTVIP